MAFEKQLLTVGEAAAMLSLSARTLEADRARGTIGIPFVRIGRQVRYRRLDLEQFVDSHLVQGGAAPGRACYPASAGSTPAPATIAKTTRGTVMARDGEGDCRPKTRRDRDSRERPAANLPPAAAESHPGSSNPRRRRGLSTTQGQEVSA